MAANDLKLSQRSGPRFIDLRPAGADPRRELAAGLRAECATISPKFFYDTLGSRLFEAICELPEYTLTRDERAIFDTALPEIAGRIGPGSALVDLGAGNCEKASRMFGPLAPSQYVAVDIAADFLRERLAALAERFPRLPMVGIAQDFTRELRLPAPVAPAPRTVFYPGSSIGNFTPDDAQAFLARARAAAGSYGHLLLGVDLVKPKAVLELAYDDPLKVTAAFNLNLLRNVNRLLDADFDLAHWRHVALFNAAASRVEMHLEADRDVTVRWRDGQRTFAAGERIHTENSHKYTVDRVRAMLLYAGFSSVEFYSDDAQRFAVALAAA
jgi:L-histidine Nalpha-methyltransferase